MTLDELKAKLERERGEAEERWHDPVFDRIAHAVAGCKAEALRVVLLRLDEVECARCKELDEVSRFTPPRYDEVYEEGAAWLEAIARGEIDESDQEA